MTSLLLVGFLGVAGIQPGDPAEPVMVRTQFGQGSGAPIACVENDDIGYTIYVLTCAHVARGLGETEHYVHDSADLAIVTLFSHEPVECFPLSRRLPRTGETLTMGGHPLGVPNYLLYEGIVSELDDDGAWWLGAVSMPGASGGPVYDEDRRLVAVIGGYWGNGRTAVGTFVWAVEPFLDWITAQAPALTHL